MSDFKESLYKKKSFIYQIGEEYYAIGANTFAKVTDSPEVDNIELLQNALQKGNDRQIEKYLEKIGEYESRERCLEVIDEIQEKCESYLYAPGNPGLLRGSAAFPPMAEIIPRVYQMPEK